MVGAPGRSGGDRSIGSDTTVDDGGPRCPASLPEPVRAKWLEVVEQVPKGLLRRVDSHQLRLLAELLHGADALAEQVRADPENDRARRLFLQTCDRVNRLSAQFGLSPSDRQRLKVDPIEDDDPFEEFLKSRIKSLG